MAFAIRPMHGRAGLRAYLAILSLAGGVSLSDAAETKLTEFVGVWHGRGTDRTSPLQTAQSTNCRMKIQADEHRLVSDTKCNGERGLAKTLHLSVVIDGDKVSGEAKQTAQAPGGEPDILRGSVSGTRGDEEANLIVRFPGLTPNASIVLTRNNPSTFNMNISSLGLTLTDVTFHLASAQ